MDYTVAILPGGDLFIRQSSLAFFVTAEYAGYFTSSEGDSMPEVISAMPLHFETDMYNFEIACSDGRQRKFSVPRGFAQSNKGGITMFSS
jgi:hypothetical protein